MRFYRTVVAACCALLLLFGCTSEKGAPAVPEKGVTSKITVVATEGESINMEDVEINLPKASGKTTYSGSGVTIDASNIQDGYVMVKADSEKRLKVQVLKAEDGYNYDLNNSDQYEVFPLQMGDGAYNVRVMEQVEGTSYAQLFEKTLEVELKDQNRVFVFPNQYVWYTNATPAIEKSYELCQGIADERQKLNVIYRFVVDTLAYDDELAEKVRGKSGYLPNLGDLLETKKGICFDYAALLGAMLRAQDIPVALVMGNVQPENILHAWNQVYVDGKWVWCDATMDGTGHKASDYTEERRY